MLNPACGMTGTTSGFGKRLVNAVLKRGDRAIATGRNQEKLVEAFQDLSDALKQNLRTIPLDTTEGETSLKAKVEAAASFWGRIDVLVNNAGQCSSLVVCYTRNMLSLV